MLGAPHSSQRKSEAELSVAVQDNRVIQEVSFQRNKRDDHDNGKIDSFWISSYLYEYVSKQLNVLYSDTTILKSMNQSNR